MQASAPTRIPWVVLYMLLFVTAAMLVAAQQPAGTAVEDHAALAQSYRAQAVEFRSQAAKHQRSAQAHRRMSGKAESAHNAMARHCDKIATQLSQAASESDKLAALHDQMSRSP